MASNLQVSVLCLVATFVVFQAVLVRSEEKKFACKGHDITLSDKQIDAMKSCAESAGIKTMEEMSPDKLPCFAKCVMEKAGLVDEAGKPHKENIMNDIDASVPKEMQEHYKAAIEKCITEHGHHISPNDQTCLSYNPLAMCCTQAMKTLCQG